jgi:hypothetical protein
VQFAVRIACCGQEAVSVGGGEIAPYPHGDVHPVDQRIVTDDGANVIHDPDDTGTGAVAARRRL